MPNPTLIADFYGKGRDFGIWHILPWKQVSISLSKVLTYGEGFEGITMEFGLLVVQSITLLIIGIILYDRYQMKAE